MLNANQIVPTAVFVAVTLAGTASANPLAKLTAAQQKELAVFGMRAMGLKVSPKDINKALTPDETLQLLATGLNLNSFLCATVVNVSPLKVKSGYEVTCVANRGGSAKKSYVVDALAGGASEL